MIFSSYYDMPELMTHLPKVGDTVTYNVPSRRQAATVTKRYRRKIFDSSSVFVKLSCDVKVYPIEVIQYWPEQGDIVEVSIAQYLAWQSQEQNESIHKIKAPHQLFQRFTVERIRDRKAIINCDGFITAVPTSILRVVEVMGVRKRDVTPDIKQLANPEKVAADEASVTTFERKQLDILEVLGVPL